MEVLDRLWAYSQVDQEVDKIEAEKRALPIRQTQAKLRGELEEYRGQLTKMEQEVETRQGRVDGIKRTMEEMLVEYQRDTAEAAEIEDAEQANFLLQRANKMLRILNDKERELQNLIKALKDMDRRIRTIVARYNKGRTSYDELKEQYNQECAKIENAHRALYDKQAQLAAELPPDLLKKYQNIKVNRPNVMVPIHGDRCGGCNMSLAALVLKNVQDGDRIIECENCGRIFYMGAQ